MNLKSVRALAFVALLIWAALPAMAEPATEASVDTLLQVTHSESMLDQVVANLETMIRQSMQHAVAGRKLDDAQQRVIQAAPARIAEVMRSELSWARMRPIYVAIYRESFDQAEVDGLIAFYSSPVGQSCIAKMPDVLKRTMGVTQVQIQELMPRIKAAMDEVLQQARLPAGT